MKRKHKHTESSRAVGYVRVSTEGQATDGVSLEAQQAKVKAYCDLNGLELLHVYSDAGISGKRADNRPELQKALDAICNRNADALVVHKLDRLARNTIDALEIAQIIEKCDGTLHSITEKLDTGSAMGRFFFTLLASLAEMERGLISERTSAALAHKRTKGEATGHAPFGWKLCADGKRLKRDGEEQETLRIIAALQARGLSQRKIVEELNRQSRKTKQGGKWQRSNLVSVLATLERRQTV
jgi:DNA invertase Pin-like site-specific DNA recombinase